VRSLTSLATSITPSAVTLHLRSQSFIKELEVSVGQCSAVARRHHHNTPSLSASGIVGLRLVPPVAPCPRHISTERALDRGLKLSQIVSHHFCCLLVQGVGWIRFLHHTKESYMETKHASDVGSAIIDIPKSAPGIRRKGR
jgi:hypothetical protein